MAKEVGLHDGCGGLKGRCKGAAGSLLPRCAPLLLRVASFGFVFWVEVNTHCKLDRVSVTGRRLKCAFPLVHTCLTDFEFSALRIEMLSLFFLRVELC